LRLGLVHDYITQLGGAERVVLSMLKAFPGAPVHTALYEPGTTYPEFEAADVRPFSVNRFRTLRTHHRRALPLLASSFSRTWLDYDVVLCSSSGWAHGVQNTGRKVVYCHSPARWLYQTERYLGSERGLRSAGRAMAIKGLRTSLMDWDRKASASADVFLANSRMVRGAIRDIYGRDAEVLPPPPALSYAGRREATFGVAPGFFLCVSRLLPYKNVDAVISAFAGRDEQLLIVGVGPDRDRLAELATSNVQFVGSVTDDRLRWLYENCQAIVSASYEDYGLTPLEAASFGKPSVALRWGGFLDNIIENETGLFFDDPTPSAVRDALREFVARSWDPAPMLELANRRSEARFAARLQQIVGEEHRVIDLSDRAEPAQQVIRLPDVEPAHLVRLPDVASRMVR
jgi:glycosyltransferase involved in cell wall biosynthesis